MQSEAWIYLLLIGCTTYFSIASITIASSTFAHHLIPALSSSFGNILKIVIEASSTLLPHLVNIDRTTDGLSSLSIAVFRGAMLGISFIISSNFSPHHGTGSGIPEIRSVLSGASISNSMTWKILCAKSISLIFTLSSQISIGRLGPLLQISSITAYLMSRIPFFPKLRNSFKLQTQAICAASAAAVGATFGAPLGGVLFSFELLSLYGEMEVMPMALYCSILGYYFSCAVIQNPSSYFTIPKVPRNAIFLNQLVPSVVIGISCGVLGALFVRYAKNMFHLQKMHFQRKSKWYITKVLIAFGIVHTLASSQMSSMLSKSQSKAVEELLTVENTSTINMLPLETHLFRSQQLNIFFKLISLLIMKFILTGISVSLPICGGVFLPIFHIGALFGRALGELMGRSNTLGSVSPKFASLLGAAGMISASLHTVSFSLIILELSCNQVDLVPLTLSVLISYGVSKNLSSDLYSTFIELKKIPCLMADAIVYGVDEDHLLGEGMKTVAGSLMRTSFPFITRTSTRMDIWETLENRITAWQSCAFLSDRNGKRFLGTISHKTLVNIIMEDMDIKENMINNKETENFLLINHHPAYGAFAASKEEIGRGLQTIPFLSEFDPLIGHPLVDSTSIISTYHTPICKVISIFRALGISETYITRNGATVGILSKLDVQGYLLNRGLKESCQNSRGAETIGRKIDQSPFCSEPSSTISSTMSSTEIQSSESSASTPVYNGIPVPLAFRNFRRGGAGMPSSVAEARRIGRNRVIFKIERFPMKSEHNEDDLFHILGIGDR